MKEKMMTNKMVIKGKINLPKNTKYSRILLIEKELASLFLCSLTNSAMNRMNGTTIWYNSHHSTAFIYDVVGRVLLTDA